MSIVFNDNLLNRSPKDLNDKSGVFESGVWRPWNSISEAINSSKLIPEYRHVGLTIYILKSGVLTEYWWRDGIADNQLIEKISVKSEIITSDIYSSAVNIGQPNSIIAEELIGCDLSFFVAHRGIGTVLAGKPSVPTDNTVQVNNATGEVIFKYPFTDFQEYVWFDYKRPLIDSITPPGGGLPYVLPFTLS